MFRLSLFAALALVLAGGATPARAAIQWKDCLSQPTAWYGTAEAIRIADNVLAYQRRTGGWPKNIDMAAPLSAADRVRLEGEKQRTDSTIDNGATYTQVRFLAQVIAGSRLGRFQAAFTRGLDYLLAAEYRDGGWPQFYPLRRDYSRHITFNDDAMIGVMSLLRDVVSATRPFEFVDVARRRRAARAIDRGIEVILRAQVRVEGRPTAWCAQHDEVTLQPAGARTYEHPSLSGRESVEIVRFLMGIEHPSPRVVRAIDGAVAWFQAAAIRGLRVVPRPPTQPGLANDVAVEADPTAPAVWARFYEIGTNRPIFSGRDGIVKYALAEIEYERRANYRWYGSWPATLLEKDYPQWKKRNGLGP